VLLLSFGYYEEVPEEVSMLLSFFAAMVFFAAVAEALFSSKLFGRPSSLINIDQKHRI
jgi:branched-subunit amino acid transport protein